MNTKFTAQRMGLYSRKEMETQEGVILIAENIKPMNVNDAYKNVPGKGRIKSGDYRRFKTTLEEKLHTYEDEKREFLEYIEGKRFYLQTTLNIYVPHDRYFTKKGDISRNKGDCGNFRKCTQDVVFDWLGIDDKYSVKEHNYQIEDDQGLWGFSFKIEAEML